MTRDDGYWLIYNIFDAQDFAAGSSGGYGPYQKMVRFLPVFGMENVSPGSDLFDLGAILHIFWENEYGEPEGVPYFPDGILDIDEFSGHLVDRLSTFIDFIETTQGEEIIIHALAHNNTIKEILNLRLETWNDTLSLYANPDKPSTTRPVGIHKMMIKWPQAAPVSFAEFQDVDFYSWYEQMYYREKRDIKQTFDKLKSDWKQKILYITNSIKDALETEEYFYETKKEALFYLASNFAFDENLNWEDSSPEGGPSTPSTYESGVKLGSIDFESIPMPYRIGVLYGYLRIPSGSDTRYIIAGSSERSFNGWMLRLLDEDYSYKELPTWSVLSGTLIRGQGSNPDKVKEEKHLKRAFDKIKQQIKTKYG